MLLPEDHTTQTRWAVQHNKSREQKPHFSFWACDLRGAVICIYAVDFGFPVQSPKMVQVSVSSTKHFCLQVPELPCLECFIFPQAAILSVQLKKYLLEPQWKDSDEIVLIKNNSLSLLHTHKKKESERSG